VAQKQKKVEVQPWEVQFVQCELGKDDKDRLEKWDTGAAETIVILERLVQDGFKLSVWGDKLHDCCGASITEPVRESGDRKRCLTGRGPDFIGAMRAVAYKHAIMLDGDWGNQQPPEDHRSSWS
jgi:hypothetical protein